jgi:hypothetical protein
MPNRPGEIDDFGRHCRRLHSSAVPPEGDDCGTPNRSVRERIYTSR